MPAKDSRLFENRRWLARIWGGDTHSRVCGSAFSVEATHLLTCAHVVLDAGARGPGDRVWVDFPQLENNAGGWAEVLAEAWQPPPPAGAPQSRGDSALLRLADPPAQLEPLPLARRASCNGLNFAAYGFPQGQLDSDAAHGRLGLSVGDDWVRMEADSAALVEPGFSGSAVWSRELGAAVAMVVTRRVANKLVAYALPLERLAVHSRVIESAVSSTLQPLAWLSRVPAGLQADVIVFSRLIEERTTDFVGRDFIFEAVHQRLRDADCGYIFIRGEPGIGKSALMAQLARTQGWVHHFNIAPENLRSPARFLRNACAQLVLRYGLPLEVLPAGADTDARLLGELLAQATMSDAGRVVLLIDALDESEEPPVGVNRLCLPSNLPSGAFVVATIRSNVDEQIDSPQRCDDIVLKEDALANKVDVAAYIRAFLRRNTHCMPARLADWGLNEATFEQRVVLASEGNFMYLRHVLPELASGALAPDSDAALPKGLIGYYQRHWRTMQTRERARFARLHKPVLAFLAIAREAVSAEAVAGWMNESGDFAPTDAGEIEDLFQQWREFLQEQTGPQLRYRLYHNSYLDFLNGELKLARYRRIQAQVMRDRVEWDER